MQFQGVAVEPLEQAIGPFAGGEGLLRPPLSVSPSHSGPHSWDQRHPLLHDVIRRNTPKKYVKHIATVVLGGSDEWDFCNAFVFSKFFYSVRAFRV